MFALLPLCFFEQDKIYSSAGLLIFFLMFFREIVSKEITGSYAMFEGLGLYKSYRFHIVSSNNVGNSTSTATVFVPKENKGTYNRVGFQLPYLVTSCIV